MVGPLDTVSAVTLYGSDSRRIIDEVFAAVSDIDMRMSAISQDSELARISAGAGGPVAVSSDVFALVEEALAISAETNGAFDPTIRPVATLWDLGSGNERIPSDNEIAEAMSKIGYARVTLDKTTRGVSLDSLGMALDLGGIAKGYACDTAVAILKKNGARRGIIDLGGNIYAYGTKLGGKPWVVGVRTPIPGENGYFCTLNVSDKAVVTSGAYERFFEKDGRRYHHIFDPSTGRPADNGLLSVTIVASSATVADALSTACFVMGAERGRAFLAERRDAEGIFVTEGMDVLLSPGLLGQVEIADGRFRLAGEK
ncbi:MAG: FAD:protein FMN transferase [Clostridiales Family XIII bacterium]|nr:FAD:protein FMN transferase [Clostridiales Family XIII bacterium]